MVWKRYSILTKVCTWLVRHPDHLVFYWESKIEALALQDEYLRKVLQPFKYWPLFLSFLSRLVTVITLSTLFTELPSDRVFPWCGSWTTNRENSFTRIFNLYESAPIRCELASIRIVRNTPESSKSFAIVWLDYAFLVSGKIPTLSPSHRGGLKYDSYIAISTDETYWLKAWRRLIRLDRIFLFTEAVRRLK